MSIDILKEELKTEKIRNLYLFYGEEEFLKKHYFDSIEKIVLKDDVTGLNKTVIDGKVDIQKIYEACETLPAFLERKLVLVKNSGLFKPKKDSAKKGTKDEFLEYLQTLPPYNCLIFYEESIDKRIKLVDAIKKNGLIVEFPHQKQNDIVKWACKIFKSHKKQIDTEAVSFLIETSEPGMTEILNEINKLLLFAGEKSTIEIDDIKKVCTKSVKSRIFDLTDAIAEKNINLALKLLNDMVILKEPMSKILFMIARQLRQILEMKLLILEGLGAKEASSHMGITPYIGNKILKQTKIFTVDALKEAVQEALDLDLSIKTGKINDRIAAEMLIFKLSEKT